VRIGFNALCISPDYKGGVNSFVFGLIDAFARVGGAHEFAVFVNPPTRAMFDKYETCSHFRIIETNQAGSWQLYRAYHRLPWQIRYRLPMPVNSFLAGRCARLIEREADVHFVPFCPPPLFPFPAVPTLYSIHDTGILHPAATAGTQTGARAMHRARNHHPS
jgi:hypothetical protein